MKCPHCNGTGEVRDDRIARFGDYGKDTGGLSTVKLTPAPTIDRINRIISAVKRAETAPDGSQHAFALFELRRYLRFIHSKVQATSEEVAREYFHGGPGCIAGRHKTLRALCNKIHKELMLEMLLEKTSFQNTKIWKLTPFGETIAAPERSYESTPSLRGGIIDV